MNIVPLKREIEQIAKDKGIGRETIVEALEEAMRQAARKRYGQEKEIEARFNAETGEIELFEFREVVDAITDESTQILVDSARDFDPEAEVGDEIGVKLDTSGFGRILAQTAKQVIIQRVRDAERDIVYEEYKDRKGEILNGIVRRFEKGALIVDLGRAEAVLPPKEQVPRENYRPGDRIRAYVTDVNHATRGPQIVLSRASVDFLRKLFEQEVPEIYEGIVTIESAAREPGGRSKIAVASRDSDVDPVGACVGMKGSRVQAVVQELRGERIDIVPWSPDAARYVCSALSPAQVSKVIIDEGAGSMDVVVPDDQLSLAIGRKGQNVRLAVQLTGWKIDIKSESRLREVALWFADAVSVVPGCGEPEAELLLQRGITSLEDLAECQTELLSSLPGIDEAGAEAIKQRAAELAERKAAEDAAAAAEAEAEAAAAAGLAEGEALGAGGEPADAGPASVEPEAAGGEKWETTDTRGGAPRWSPASTNERRRQATRMAKVRAYKIAEELGIERNEFVEKARAAGVELRNAMASVDEEQAELLREKLGAKARKGPVTEARVERKGGTAVIRRRKRRAAAEPAPSEEAPPAAPEGEPLPAEEPAAAEPAAPPAAGEPAPAEPGGPAPEPSPEPGAPEPAAPEAPQPVAARGKEEARPSAPRPEAERGPPSPAERKGKQRKQFREVVNLREQEQIARQVTSRTTGRTAPPSVDPRAFTPPRRKRRDQPQKKAAPSAPPKAEKRVVRVEGEISVAELAKQLGAKAPEIQGKLMALGTMVTLHQTIDVPTAEKVAQDYGFDVQDVGFQEAEYLEAPEEQSGEENLRPRPAVVTVMGHVDHGKTSLLDAIRKANVVSGEAGGITQHIGAYQAQHGDSVITFIDTPGHEAFTAMRARGAGATDVVILVVAASEGIMPQTVEAIDHARAAGVPLVVAINKCDLPDANPQLARQRLMEHGLVTEEFGGDVLAVEVSATKRTGLDALLEAVALQAEMLEPKADPTRRAKGVVLEAKLEKGRGPVATVLVQEGTLHRGDHVVVGTVFGRVRAMQNERGESLKEAGPSTPVQVVGLSGVPDAGQTVHAVESERVAKEIVSHREDQQRAQPAAPKPKVSLEELFAQAEGEGPKELNVVIKADTQGSAEALRESLLKLPTDKVKLNVLHTAVGAVSESDVQLAQASGAIVVGFHVRPDGAARKAAENAGVDVRLYQVIYEAIDEIRGAMAGLLPPTVKEVTLGSAEVRQTFTIPRVGTIAGCYITEGRVRRNARARVVRDGVQVWEGRLASLKRFKDDVREVQSGYECGIGLEGFNDVKVGDRIESFEHEEQPAEL